MKISGDRAKIQEITRRYKAGETLAKTGEAFGVSGAMILNILRAAGVENRQPPRFVATPKNRRAIIKKYESGFTLKAIAKHFRTDSARISRLLNSSGIKRRDLGRTAGIEISKLRNELKKSLVGAKVPAARLRILKTLAKHPDLTYEEIAVMCGCTRQNVHHCLKTHLERMKGGAPKTRGRKPRDPEFIRRVVEMHRSTPTDKVAKRFGISKATVLLYARRGLA